jgi:hypothetical protein
MFFIRLFCAIVLPCVTFWAYKNFKTALTLTTIWMVSLAVLIGWWAGFGTLLLILLMLYALALEFEHG